MMTLKDEKMKRKMEGGRVQANKENDGCHKYYSVIPRCLV